MLDVLFTLLDAVRKYPTLGERVYSGSSPLWRGRLGWPEAEVVVRTVLSQETLAGWI